VEVLLDKGKVSQARAAFALLIKMPPTPEIDDLALRLARESGDFTSTANVAARLLTVGGQGDDDDLQKLRAADVLVLSFADFPVSLASEHPDTAAELRQVHRALELICKKSYNEALAAVGHLGRRSLFAHWRLFIKGMVAFYRDEDDKARQAFQRLPENSWLSGAASTFQLLLLPAGDAQCRQLAKNESRLRDACMLAGCQELVDVLPRANYLWMTGRYRDSFRYLRRSLANFPAETPDVYGSLTRFYYNAGYHLEGEQRDRYIHFLFDASQKILEKNKTAVLQGMRLTALYFEIDGGEEEGVIYIWQEFIRRYQHFYGEHKGLNSLIYAHLGALFAREGEVVDMKMNPFHLPGYHDAGRDEPDILDPEKAEKYFLLSIEEDEQNSQAWLSLLDLYDNAGWKSKKNRLLDDIIKRFPDDKDALLKAGAGCCERHAWHKGLKYLRRALDLGLPDSFVQEKFMLATASLALEQVFKGQVERCRSLLDDVLAIARPELDEFNRGRSYYLGRWVVFSMIAGRNDEAWEYYEQALEQAPNPDKLLYFTWIYALCRGIDVRSLSRLKKPLKKLFAAAAVSTAMDFLEVFKYSRQLIDDEYEPLEKEEKQLRVLLAKAMRRAETGQVVQVLEYAFDDAVAGKRLVRACLRRLKALDARSPHYLFYSFVAERLIGMKFPQAQDVAYLKRILSQAEATQDRELVGRIKEQIAGMEMFVNLCENLDVSADDLAELDEDGDFEEEEELDADADSCWDMPLPPPGASQVPASWKRNHRSSSMPPSPKKDQSPQTSNELSEARSLFDMFDD
ncbi:MAG: hypothetical protein KAW01_01835, partial [Deltaproteobacteria bacterium]|nr:hypothetical protein [Deltaproteobacteria bacterium]